jgi:hypothetical protein
MQLFSWLTKRMTGRPQNRRAPACRPASRFRPQLEALEERWVLSTLTVTTNLDSGHGSLRYEIAQAEKSSGKNTIVFAPSLDGQTITLTSGELNVTKSLTIQGPGAGQLAISGSGGVNGNGSRVFETAANTQVSLSGLTIRDGDGLHGGVNSYNNDGIGGGILNSGALTLSGCTVSGNHPLADGWHSLNGGGIENLGTLTVSACTVSGNRADSGGGIYNAGTLTLSGSTLSNNIAFSNGGGGGPGGGIYNAGTLMVSGSTVSNNNAGLGYGGGIYNAGTATVQQSTLSGNTAFNGAGIFNSGTLTVSAVTLSGNVVSDYYSGGAYTHGNGGGIYNTGTLTVLDSIFSGNYPDNVYGSYTDGGGNTFG